MVNFNGTLVDQANAFISADNRGYQYGDAVFETIHVWRSNILFLEDHYFRLMSGMRILRMAIPMSFTMEFIEREIQKTLEANPFAHQNYRVRITVNRKAGGRYTPVNHDVDYLVVVEPLLVSNFENPTVNLALVDLFKDHYITPGLLSNVKSNNRLINILGGIYAKENGYNNCLLLNSDKQVVEALNGNVFLVKGTVIKTPPLSSGCIKGVMRKQVIDYITKSTDYTLEEAAISPFELQKSDELFITNVIQGIVPVLQYRKHQFSQAVSDSLFEGILSKLT